MLLLPMLLLNGACAIGPWKDFYGDVRPALIPREVRDFIIDAQGCAHFSGEEPYDAERAAFLKKNIEEMCDGIEMRHAKLTVKYASNKDVSAMIEEVSRSIFG
jgi:hypothetical protein